MRREIGIIRRLRLRGLGRGILTAFAIEAARSTGFSLSFTYLALYLYTQRGIPMTRVGVILLGSGLLAGLFQVTGGIVADKFGHRRTLIVYQAGELAAFATIAALMAANAALWSVVLAGILVPTIGSMVGTCLSAIIADISAHDRMTEAYGLLAIAGNLGWAIGPLAGGFLLGTASYGWLFAAGAFMSLLTLVGVPFLPRGREVTDARRLSLRRFSALLANRRLVVFSAICLLLFLSMAQWGSTLSVFTVERLGFSAERYGLLMTISGVLIVAFQYPMALRIERLGLRRALFLGRLLYGIGFLSLGWVTAFVPAIGSVIVLVAGEMLIVPAALAVVGRLSDPEDRAKNMGLFGLSGTLGMSLGPLLGGVLLDAFPQNALFLWGTIGLACFAAAVGFVVWRGYPGAAELHGQAQRLV